MVIFWGTDLELCSFEVCHVLAIFLSWTCLLGPLHSSIEGGAAIVSYQSRFFFSEHLWVEERWAVNLCRKDRWGRSQGCLFKFFFGEFETYLSVDCTVSYLQFLTSFGI